MPNNCRRMMTSIGVSLDVSSLTAPFGIYIPIPNGDQGMDWQEVTFGRVDFGGTANGGGISWKCYPAQMSGASTPPNSMPALVANGAFNVPNGGFVTCGSGVYEYVQPWRVQDSVFMVIEVEGGSTPASSFIEFVLGGYDDE